MHSKLLLDIKQSFTYRSILASFLVFLLIGSITVREVHHWVAHTHDHAPHCEANDNEQHFHGSEYLHSDCLICAFNFSPEEKSRGISINFKAIFLFSETYFSYQNVFVEKIILNLFLRGPPSI